MLSNLNIKWHEKIYVKAYFFFTQALCVYSDYSGYETKPALSVPIHVVELTNVPPELRMSANVATPQQQKKEKPLPEKKKEWVSHANFILSCIVG